MSFWLLWWVFTMARARCDLEIEVVFDVLKIKENDFYMISAHLSLRLPPSRPMNFLSTSNPETTISIHNTFHYQSTTTAVMSGR